MKALFLSFFIFYSIFLGAQPISNYLDYSSEWRSLFSDFSSATDTYTTYYLDGDTILNGFTYYKQYRLNKYVYLQTGNELISGPFFESYIRENSNQQFVKTNDAGDVWIDSDFSLTIGDTLPWLSCPIFSIDTVYLGATPLKRYSTEFPPIQNADSYIEGIGKTGPFCSTGIDGFGYHVCYIKGNETILLNSAFANSTVLCGNFPVPVRNYLPTRVDDLIDESTFEIYPNPASNNFMISHDHNAPIDLRIYNISGSVLQQHYDVSSGQRISVEKLPKGFYIVGTFSNDQLIRSVKLIKE